MCYTPDKPKGFSLLTCLTQKDEEKRDPIMHETTRARTRIKNERCKANKGNGFEYDVWEAMRKVQLVTRLWMMLGRTIRFGLSFL